MTRKNTVARVSPFQWAKKDLPVHFTPIELGRYLGVSRQRASALLAGGRVETAVKGEDGRWSAWLPLRVVPGQRGPVGRRVGRFKRFERPLGRVRVITGAQILAFPKLGGVA